MKKNQIIMEEDWKDLNYFKFMQLPFYVGGGYLLIYDYETENWTIEGAKQIIRDIFLYDFNLIS